MLLLALVAAGQILALVHLVLVPHVTCALHDELLHGSREARAQWQGSDAPVPAQARLRPCDHGTEREVHCPVARFLRHGPPALLVDPTASCTASAREAVEPLVCTREREHSFPLYLLAPKNSPPREASLRVSIPGPRGARSA